MKKTIFNILILVATATISEAQNLKNSAVPAAAKSALLKKYPDAVKATWEKEKGNFEANWGGKSGEDMSVQFTSNGSFLEQVAAITPDKLPAGVSAYIKQHYKGAKITEAGKVTDAKGIITYEAEVRGKELVFDEKGNFMKIE